MSPREIVEKWVALFNQANIDGLASLYHENAINHQVANELIHGRTNIHKMFKEEFANADMTCIVRISLKMVNGPY